MSEQSKGEHNQATPAASGPGEPASETEAPPPAGSPFDAPTGEMPSHASGSGGQVPRTEAELGLEPELSSSGKVPEMSTEKATSDTESSDPETYAYASIPPAVTPPAGTESARRRNGVDRRGTLDAGLLLLRLVVGGTFLYHGLQKLTGWFGGPGLDGTRDMMEQGGWDHPSLAAALLIAGELGGGFLLIIGLITPLAAGAVLAVILDAWAFKQGMEPGFQYSQGDTAVELDTILAGAAAVIILTGPGRWSLDRSRGWATRPFIGSSVVLLLAAAAAVVTWWVLHGGNPLVGIG